MPAVVGVDSSTSATKVVACDLADGRRISGSRSPHPATTPPRSEQDPDVWWTALTQAWAAAGGAGGAAERGGARPPVRAISVAAQQHGLVPLDRRYQVLRPAKLWNDTESSPDAIDLQSRLGGPAGWIDACGSVPRAAFTVTKVAWLKRVEPRNFDALRFLALPHDWLVLRLTGVLATDRGDASGTGYWSPVEERWRPDLLALIDAGRDWHEALPRLLGPREPAGTLRAPLLDLDAGTVVGPGTGDNMAAALGLGLEPGDVAVSIGTSGTVFAVSGAPPPDQRQDVAGFADATGRYLPLACTLNASKVTETFARLLGVDRDQLGRLALEAPPGARGVVLVPYLDGERTPDVPGASGHLSGIRTSSTAPDVARACVEGVVCGLLEALDQLARSGIACCGRLLVIGGGARMPAYPQIVADLTGRCVEAVPDDEIVARGAAMQAAAALTGREPLALAQQWAPVETRRFEPAPVDAAAVRQAYAAARDVVVQQAARAQVSAGGTRPTTPPGG